MKFRKGVLDLNDGNFIIIRELSYITGISLNDLIEKMIDTWLKSKECSSLISQYIIDYKSELKK